MDELLIITHRIPYPPDKGDKIRAWNFFRYLAARYDVYLGTFIDEERDWQFTAQLRDLCRESYFARLTPAYARLRSLRGLVSGSALTLPYYYDPGFYAWASRVLKRPQLRRVFVYCSAMAQYVNVENKHNRRCVVDLVDIDSEKWLDYGRRMHGPKGKLLRREGTKLRALEREIVSTADETIVSTKAEEDLLRSFLPDKSAGQITCIQNGVDTEYFSPERRYVKPPEISGTSLVFTGAMDYWPNIDAITYFANNVFPQVKARVPDARLIVVGSNPTSVVRALTLRQDIIVTGRVPDVRPYIAHSQAIIAPLRVARGVQNKVLEAMAMAKPVIASREATNGIGAQPDKELLVADNHPLAFTNAVEAVTCSEWGSMLGRSARKYVLQKHDWGRSASRLQERIEA